MSDVKKYGLSGVGSNVELGKDGLRIKDTGSRIEFRDATDSNLVPIRAGNPLTDDDVITKGYLEKTAEIAVSGEIYDDTGITGVPGTPTVGQIFIAKDTVGFATVNRLYRAITTEAIASAVLGTDMEEIIPPEGLRITVTDSLPNGGFTLEADHVYVWDEDGGTWVDIGPAPTQVDVVKSKKISVNTTATQLIQNAPAGSTGLRVAFRVTTPYSGGTSITIGDSGDNANIMASNEIKENQAGVYIAEAFVEYSVATDVNVYISGSPGAGAGVLEFQYATH